MSEIWEEYKIVIVNDRAEDGVESDLLDLTNEFQERLVALIKEYTNPELLGMTIQLSDSEGQIL